MCICIRSCNGRVCSFCVKTNRSLSKVGGGGSPVAMYADTKTKLSPFWHTLLTLTATIYPSENIGVREQQRLGVAEMHAPGRFLFSIP